MFFCRRMAKQIMPAQGEGDSLWRDYCRSPAYVPMSSPDSYDNRMPDSDAVQMLLMTGFHTSWTHMQLEDNRRLSATAVMVQMWTYPKTLLCLTYCTCYVSIRV